MADPIIQRHFRVQAVFQGISGLPEDRIVNNWAFRNDETTAGVTEFGGAVVRVLDAFYFTPSPAGLRVSQYFSAQLDPAQVEYRIYDLGQAPPRDPMVRVPAVTPTWSSSATPLPQEVASCLSLVLADTGQTGGINEATTIADTVPIPRRSRVGRIYLGPLVTGVVNYQGGRPIVEPAWRTCVLDRATNVLETSENVTWCVISQVHRAAVDVVGGYMDDAFDTQRRRGRAPVTRDPFGSYLVPS